MSKRTLTVAGVDPRELLPFLIARLKLREKDAEELLRNGAVFYGGRRSILATEKLRLGERITVYLPAEKLASPDAAPQPKSPSIGLPVIYSDDCLLIIDKPPGLPTQPGRRGGPSLLSLLPSPLFPVHRLDADASGLIVLARDPGVAAHLQATLQDGKLNREYLAVIEGELAPRDGHIDLRIGPADGRGPMSPRYRAYPAQSSLGQPARTHYRLLGPHAEQPSRSVVCLQLLTGRTHQIRVHLAARSRPIVGDRLYGGEAAPRLLLHAFRLELIHPKTGKAQQFTAPPSVDFGLLARLDLATPATAAS